VSRARFRGIPRLHLIGTPSRVPAGRYHRKDHPVRATWSPTHQNHSLAARRPLGNPPPPVGAPRPGPGEQERPTSPFIRASELAGRQRRGEQREREKLAPLLGENPARSRNRPPSFPPLMSLFAEESFSACRKALASGSRTRADARRHRSYAPCLLRRSNVAPRNCSQTVPRDANFLAAL